MADGQVLIDSKIDTGGVTKGANKIEKEFDQLAKITKKTAQIMEQNLKNVDLENLADGMSDSFEAEGEQVERSVEKTAESVEESAEKMADAMDDSAKEQADAMEDAWDKTEREAKTGSRKVQEDIDDIGDKAKAAGNDIESSLGKAFAGLASKLGGGIATLFALDELVEFGRDAVEIGSALAEVQNVVDVTFGESSKIIDDFARNAIKQFGLSELSAKQFTSTLGAMLKSIGGFDESQILEMSTALAGLAGDMASFYNLDVQEAFDKLRSGISGETEPLKQLGINLSVANLEAYALANGIKKSYDKMTEQEKALLRYNYLLSATADAQGDFVRTQDSWANQTRILSEEFNSLKGTLGQGLINVLNPIVTSINGRFMPALQSLADKFVELTETFKWGDLFSGIDFGPYLSSLGSLGESFLNLASIIGSGLKFAYDNVLIPFGTWHVEKGLPSLLNALSSAFGAVAAAVEYLAPLGTALWNGFLGPLMSFTGDLLAATFEAVAGAIQWIADSISNLIGTLPSIEEIGNRIKEGFPKVAQTVGDAFTRAGHYAQTGMIEPISAGLDDVSAKSAETAAKVGTDMAAVTETVAASATETTATAVAGMETLTAAAQENIASVGDTAVASAESTKNQIANSYVDAANTAANTAFVPMAESAESTAEMTAESFDDAANTFKAAWSGMGTWFESNVASPIRISVESVSTTMTEKLGEMVSETQTAWANMVLIVNQSIDQMQNKINSLTGKTVDINFNKTGAGASYASYSGYDGKAYTPATYAVTPQIPYLATGAVIPPRAPFLAMLGDQRNGSNLEAPESLIRKIVREETGGELVVKAEVSFAGTMAQFVRNLFPHIKAEAKRRGKSLATEVIE